MAATSGARGTPVCIVVEWRKARKNETPPQRRVSFGRIGWGELVRSFVPTANLGQQGGQLAKRLPTDR